MASLRIAARFRIEAVPPPAKRLKRRGSVKENSETGPVGSVVRMEGTQSIGEGNSDVMGHCTLPLATSTPNLVKNPQQGKKRKLEASDMAKSDGAASCQPQRLMPKLVAACRTKKVTSQAKQQFEAHPAAKPALRDIQFAAGNKPWLCKPFRPELEHHSTNIQPFSFEWRTNDLMRRRAVHLNSAVQEEQKLRQFKASPLPNFYQGQETDEMQAQEQSEAFSFPAQLVAVLQEPQHTTSLIKSKPFSLQS